MNLKCTLWKPYLFSWRTKLAKLECLYIFGRRILLNLSRFCRDGVSRSRKVDAREKVEEDVH
jgi:hypothetical protein